VLEKKQEKPVAIQTIQKLVLLFVLLYFFILSIELMKDSFQFFGKDFAKTLFRATSSPIVGMCIGLLCTSIIQSSSSTTSIVVSMVAAASLDVRSAIPIIMGANIGTSVTNVLVAAAHITRREEFRRAYSASLVHDQFNVLSVLVLLPLEMSFHLLEKIAGFLQTAFQGVGGMKLFNPVKPLVGPIAKKTMQALEGLFQDGSNWPGILGLVIALTLLFVTLKFLVDFLKSVMIGRVEQMMHGFFFATPVRAFLLGLIVTAAIQSSSITTSLVVPLAAGGILTLEQIFPFALGANIGTTITALLASLVTQDPAAVTAAFAHTSFNVVGSVIFYPLKQIPIGLARWFGNLAYHRRITALVYIIVVFFLLPGLVIFLFGR